uniref:TniQ family protein n=1 Tax=Pseudomonas avellanae TaxID=46257 RepID=UPI0005C955C2
KAHLAHGRLGSGGQAIFAYLRLVRRFPRDEYISSSSVYGSDSTAAGFCPVCVAEDIERLGFSFWRRAHCCELKVCAEHNVELVKHCPYCDKPFRHGGHDLNVMWTTCEGQQLKDSSVMLNADQFELKKAQFFAEILSATHHLSEEAVLAVLDEKVHQNENLKLRIWDSRYNQPLVCCLKNKCSVKSSILAR